MLKVAKEFVGRNLSFAMFHKDMFGFAISRDFGLNPDNLTIAVGITVGQHDDGWAVTKFLMKKKFRWETYNFLSHLTQSRDW